MSAFTHAISTNNYGPAKFIVDASPANGTHTTIAAALTSASSGDTIFIRPGTYAENLTLKAGVDLVAFVTDSDVPNVIIQGKCTFTVAGTVGISGIQLQTNSDFFLAVTGSAASIVYLNDCYLNCLNNTGISYTSSSSSSAINANDCIGNIGTTGISLYSSSSAGTISFNYCIVTNTGAATTASTNSAGSANLTYSQIYFPLTVSSAATLNFNGGFINTIAINTACITSSGTSNVAVHNCPSFSSGTASSLSIGTGTQLINYQSMEIQSSNTNAITGLGTIQYGLIVYTGSSSTNNTSTQIALTTQPSLGGSSASGTVVQQIRKTSTTATSTATTLLQTGTTPTTSNTTSLITQAVTPTSATNVLLFEFCAPFSNGAGAVATAGFFLFAGSTLLASFPFQCSSNAGATGNTATFSYYAVSGTTSSTTYAVYYASTSGTTYILSDAGTAFYGGAGATAIIFTITEVKP